MFSWSHCIMTQAWSYVLMEEVENRPHVHADSSLCQPWETEVIYFKLLISKMYAE